VRVHIYTEYIYIYGSSRRRLTGGRASTVISSSLRRKKNLRRRRHHPVAGPSRSRSYSRTPSPPSPHPTTLRATVNDEVVVKKNLPYKSTPAAARRSQCSRFVLVFRLLIFCIRNAEQTPRWYFPKYLNSEWGKEKNKIIFDRLSICRYRVGTPPRFLSFPRTLPLVLSLSFPLYTPSLSFSLSLSLSLSHCYIYHTFSF